MNKAERIKMVKAMEFIARQINDEEVFYTWLMGGVADGDIEYGDLDGADLDGVCEWYIRDGAFAELMQCFLRHMTYARKSGGLYCDGVVSRSRAEEAIKAREEYSNEQDTEIHA